MSTSLYAIELHRVYDRPGQHPLFGLFHGTAAQCRAKLRLLRQQHAEDIGPGRGQTIHMRWLRNVPPEVTAADVAPFTLMDEDGWVPADYLQEAMES